MRSSIFSRGNKWTWSRVALSSRHRFPRYLLAHLQNGKGTINHCQLYNRWYFSVNHHASVQWKRKDGEWRRINDGESNYYLCTTDDFLPATIWRTRGLRIWKGMRNRGCNVWLKRFAPVIAVNVDGEFAKWSRRKFHGRFAAWNARVIYNFNNRGAGASPRGRLCSFPLTWRQSAWVMALTSGRRSFKETQPPLRRLTDLHTL